MKLKPCPNPEHAKFKPTSISNWEWWIVECGAPSCPWRVRAVIKEEAEAAWDAIPRKKVKK